MHCYDGSRQKTFLEMQRKLITKSREKRPEAAGTSWWHVNLKDKKMMKKKKRNTSIWQKRVPFFSLSR